MSPCTALAVHTGAVHLAPNMAPLQVSLDKAMQLVGDLRLKISGSARKNAQRTDMPKTNPTIQAQLPGSHILNLLV